MLRRPRATAKRNAPRAPWRGGAGKYARCLRSAKSSQHSEHVLGGHAESSQERAAVGGLDPKLFVAEAALNQPLKSQRAAQGDLDNALGKERVEPSL